MELIRNNEKAVTVKTKALWEKARAKQDGWSLRGGALVHHGRLWVPGETQRAWLIEEAHARPGAAYYGVNKLRKVLSPNTTGGDWEPIARVMWLIVGYIAG